MSLRGFAGSLAGKYQHNPKIESFSPKIEQLNPKIESLNPKIESYD